MHVTDQGLSGLRTSWILTKLQYPVARVRLEFEAQDLTTDIDVDRMMTAHALRPWIRHAYLTLKVLPNNGRIG